MIIRQEWDLMVVLADFVGPPVMVFLLFARRMERPPLSLLWLPGLALGVDTGRVARQRRPGPLRRDDRRDDTPVSVHHGPVPGHGARGGLLAGNRRPPAGQPRLRVHGEPGCLRFRVWPAVGCGRACRDHPGDHGFARGRLCPRLAAPPGVSTLPRRSPASVLSRRSPRSATHYPSRRLAAVRRPPQATHAFRQLERGLASACRGKDLRGAARQAVRAPRPRWREPTAAG